MRNDCRPCVVGRAHYAGIGSTIIHRKLREIQTKHEEASSYPLNTMLYKPWQSQIMKKIQSRWAIKQPINFMINVRVRTENTDFEVPVFLDSGMQDYFIDETFTRSQGFKMTKLPLYLQ